MREIPENAFEVQTGLWAEERTRTLGNITRTFYTLYSAEGYCFYLLSDPHNYVENDIMGELVAENERLYAQYMVSAYQTIEQINADVVSVPVQPGYEIVSVGNNHETV